MSERQRPKGYITDGSEYLIGIGSAHAVSEASDAPRRAVGRLVVPDPEQRHGWREVYVYRDADAAQPARPLGFRR
jgi:hypothetical protein